MAIIQTVTFSSFCEAFVRMNREDNFTCKAKSIIFNYLEELSEAVGHVELDVIGICCEYYEVNCSDVLQDFGLAVDLDLDNQEFAEVARDFLESNTELLGEYENADGGTVFVFQAF